MIRTVTDKTAGLRLDSFATNLLPELSRAYIQRLCQGGKITINANTAKPGQKLKAGDKVVINYDVAKLAAIPSIEIPIIYEDDDCVVMDKPAGVLSHSKGAFDAEGTVATFLRSRTNGLEGERAGIVHRLDRGTSGVIIGAKNLAALAWLQKQFAQRKVKKTYTALVEGHLKDPEAVIDMPIERNPKAPATFRAAPNGKPARTHYRVSAESADFSLLELHPETGRTHQLRVHLKEIGHPIVGDVLYGAQAADRLFLHAVSLEITLPNRQRQTFEVPTPKQFKRTIELDA